MTAAEHWNETIRRGIPLTAAMDLTVEALTPEKVVLSAPAEPNVNVHGTAFAGSIASLLTLTVWLQAQMLLENAGIEADIVARRGETDYLKPVTGTLVAESDPPDPVAVARFVSDLHRTGRGRMTLSARIKTPEGKPAAVFTGVIAARTVQEF